MSQGRVEELPDLYDEELHDEDRAGQHAGVEDPTMNTAYDYKELHNSMKEFPDDDLKSIPILANGERLEQGGIYLDLADTDRREFVASGDTEASDGHFYVPKNRVDYVLWNRLIGIDNPDRVPDGPENNP